MSRNDLTPATLACAIPGAPNFTWAEFFRSDTADSMGIENFPTADSIFDNITYLATTVLQPVRDHFNVPIVITSGYRCKAVNDAVGSTNSSFHLYGCAADIRTPLRKVPDSELFAFIANDLPFTELIAENVPSGWVHVAISKGREDEKKVKYMLSGGRVTLSTINTVLDLYRKNDL